MICHQCRPQTLSLLILVSYPALPDSGATRQPRRFTELV